MPVHIGPITVSEPVFLAPMSGVSDLPFRRAVKSFGAGLVFSEMIASRSVIEEWRSNVKVDLDYGQEFPMAVQLAGCEPDVMAEAARINVGRGAAIIDINFGCPVKKIVNSYAGSALMRDEDLAVRIIDAVVAAVDVPVTVKMRLGWDENSLNAPSLARRAEQSGVKMVTVHGRTRCQLYNGSADWHAVRKVREAIALPLLVNGDILTPADAARAMQISGADGVMIGRGAYGRPWLLSQVMHYLATGQMLADPALQVQYAVLLEHYEAMLEHYGVEAGARIARKHISWYSKGLPSSTEFRNRVNRLDDPQKVRAEIDAFYQPLLERQAA